MPNDAPGMCPVNIEGRGGKRSALDCKASLHSISMRGPAGLKICGARDPQSQEAYTPTHCAAQGGEPSLSVCPHYAPLRLQHMGERSHSQCSRFTPCVLHDTSSARPLTRTHMSAGLPHE